MSNATHNIGTEQRILSVLLENEAAFEQVNEILTDKDFYSPAHAVMYRAIVTLAANNKPFDPVSVEHFLKSHNRLEQIGGEEYFRFVASDCPSGIANVAEWAKSVREMSVNRQLIAACKQIVDMAENPKDTSGVLVTLDKAESMILAIKDKMAKTHGDKGPRKLSDLMLETVEIINSRTTAGRSLTGIDTGFSDLNAVILGLQKKDLIIVAAVPGMGKTTFAVNMIENGAKSGTLDGAAVIFSMEMSETDVVERMISSVGSVHQHNMRSADLGPYDWDGITGGVTLMREWPIYIDETPGLNLVEMRTRLRRIARNHDDKISVILVDYLQLMRTVERQDDRQQAVASFAVGLKALAKEFNCPVIALSQLSRKVGDRPNKRPMMTDLRESGYIEQAADLIMFIYRDEKYNVDTKDRGKAEIIIAKQRKGQADKTVFLGFDGAYSRFKDLDYRQGQEYAA